MLTIFKAMHAGAIAGVKSDMEPTAIISRGGPGVGFSATSVPSAGIPPLESISIANALDDPAKRDAASGDAAATHSPAGDAAIDSA